MSARVGASGSGWVPLSSNQDGLNKISIRKDLDESQPVSISFTCSREQPPFSKNQSTIFIHPDIFHVFILLQQSGNPALQRVFGMNILSIFGFF